MPGSGNDNFNIMPFDLERALRKKGEAESARLDAFHFGHRARMIRLLTHRLAERGERLDEVGLVRGVALLDDDALLASIRAMLSSSIDDGEWQQLCGDCRAVARRQLIEERGDPAPHRLA